MSTYIDTLILPFGLFFQPQQRIYWNNLLIALLIAIILCLINKPKGERLSIISFLRYIFPKRVYFDRSAINDYLFFFTNTLLMALFITPLFTLLSANIATLIDNILTNFFPAPYSLSYEINIYVIVIFTFFFGLISDFAIFFAHYLQHQVPWLWEFHKVHHSATVLTPITVYRMHPVDNILTISLSGIFFGFFYGLCDHFIQIDIRIFNIAGVNLIFVFFYIFAYNLRHSHIWFSYGPYLSYIFISPAQHQIHHSSDPKHFNKNLGFIFAIWDHFFNTLYVPKQKETIHYGINKTQDKHFLCFWSLYLMPFLNLFRNFKLSDLINPKKHLSLWVFISIVGPALYLSGSAPISDKNTSSLFIENMTWPEIKEAIATNKTTVLVPTGGTEQNGPHVILGKHNYIVEYTAGEIAKKLGNALIAPVMAYVPEGQINPPEGHMRFPGTLSISEQQFSDVLESTAKSLKTHGFKVIAFIGDSGGNQAGQKNVAEKLDALWHNEGVRVLHISDYYSHNQQINYLLNQGFNMQQIGGHAGIRDTSELLTVYSDGVRKKFLTDHSNTDFTSTGTDGDANKASTNLGKILLDLKIDAAVKQINLLLTELP